MHAIRYLAMILLSAALSVVATPAARADAAAQFYFVPLKEDTVHLALRSIDNFGGNIGSTLRSVISIAGGVSNTVIYYDQWEDGYESNTTQPTQSTTQVWGDNNPANGTPPGFAADRIGEGTIVTLQTDIPVPRNPANIHFDGGDRFAVTRPVSMTRAIYAPDPGEVLADAKQVMHVGQHGFLFRAPVGVNVSTNQMFEYSTLSVMASFNSTILEVDANNDGIFEETVYLNMGEHREVPNVHAGATLRASKPVQAHLLTGDVGSNYEMRWFTLYPEHMWDTSYYSPVCSAINGYLAEIWLFNPHTQTIAIVCETMRSTGIVTVAANGVNTYVMPTNTAARFFNTNGQYFIPAMTMDARKPSSDNQAHDWGYGLLSDKMLTTMALVPWAPGAGGSPIQYNGSPVWVAALSNTTVYVDFDGNPETGTLVDPMGRRYDFHTNLLRLARLKIYDNNDRDQSRMRIYTLDETPIACAWGLDPDIAGAGNPYLDMGTEVLPFPTLPSVKNWTLVGMEGDRPEAANAGDEIRFRIQVANQGFKDEHHVILFDAGAANAVYKADSTTLNGVLVPDDSVPPALTVFPLDENGLNIGTLAVGATCVVEYVVTVLDPFPEEELGVMNAVVVQHDSHVFIPIARHGLSLAKSSLPNEPLYPGDDIHYTLSIANTSNVRQTGIRLTDPAPPYTAWISNSTRIVLSGPSNYWYFADYFNQTNYAGSDGRLAWNSNWTEVNESDGPGAGYVRVMSDSAAPAKEFAMRLRGYSSYTRGATRRLNLAQFTNATLSFSYRRDSMDSSSDVVSVSASANGSTWTELGRIAGPGTDAVYLTTNYNLAAFLTTNTHLRFLSSSGMASDDYVWIDDVRVEVISAAVTNSGGAPPILLDNYILDPGFSVTVLFSVRIQDSVQGTQIVNQASLRSFQSAEPRHAFATNYMIRASLGGQVRNDLDGDGDFSDPEPGLNGVTIQMYSDPNGDGDPADGALLETTLTSGNGHYVFPGYFAGNYIIVQTELPGFRGTADSAPPNDNRIPVTLAEGVSSLNNIFLDSQAASINGQMRLDRDGNGNLSEPDPGLSGVTMQLWSDPNGDGDPADGALIRTATTDPAGLFEFARVTTGNYVVVQLDLPGMYSTADSAPPNDNRIPVDMPGATDRSGLVFLDASSGLGITKTASPVGIWGPDLTVNYTIHVVNTGLIHQSETAITDDLSEELSYIPGTAQIEFIGASTSVFLDAFSVRSYNQNGGTTNWLGPWVESDYTGGTQSPTNGYVRITNDMLSLQGYSTEAIYRRADLTGGQEAYLSFRYTNISAATSDRCLIQVSTSSPLAWITVAGITGRVWGVTNINITPYISTGTYIRFSVGSYYSYSVGRYFRADDVRIDRINWAPTNKTLDSPPAWISGYGLRTGDYITITYQAMVGGGYAVTNTACVTTDLEPEGVCATHVNAVDPEAFPDRIGGQVRFDRDGDGDLLDPDEPIQGVTISLYSDPDGDGDPSDGELLDATVTDYSGYYLFGNLVVGHYVVMETDRAGYVSTADSSPPNDNRIRVHLPGGVDSRGNDFLDWTISGLTIVKTSGAGDVVVPGERLVYSILVSNASHAAAHDIRVVDVLPDDATYVPDSAWAYRNGIVVTNSVRELFNSRTYTNHDGNLRWLNNWTEEGETTSPTAGYMTITADDVLRLRLSYAGRAIRRNADLSGRSHVMLNYYYRRQSLESNEYIKVELSDDGAPWVEVARHGFINGGANSQTDSSYQYASLDVTPYAGADTAIRFSTAPSGMNEYDYVWVDDISFDTIHLTNASHAAEAPPEMFTLDTLSPGAVIQITFTAEVIAAESVMNTAVVYTASDPAGLSAFTSNFVGVVGMTQGMAMAEGDVVAVRVGWSAYTNNKGEVTKEYDVLYVDESNLGFCSALTSCWQLAATVREHDFVDHGSSNRVPPSHLGNKMRFYRAAFRGAWRADKRPRHATREVYVARPVLLMEGENFVSLCMLPDQNRAAYIFGTNTLPAGETMLTSTRIEWYASTASSEATNIIWLSDAGIWQYATGGIADDMPIPLDRGFNVITPPGSGTNVLVLVGQVPPVACCEAGHVVSIVASQNYNIVSYNVPYRVRLIDSGLKQSGFTGVAPGRVFNPNESDELRILQKGGGSMAAPVYRILLNSSGAFQYWTGGSGSANNLVLEPDYALIIYTRKSATNWIWNVGLPYCAPTTTMDP